MMMIIKCTRVLPNSGPAGVQSCLTSRTGTAYRSSENMMIDILYERLSMTPAELPDIVHRLTAIVIFAVGMGMIAVHIVLATMAAPQSTRARRAPFLVAAAVGAYLTLWFSLAIAV